MATLANASLILATTLEAFKTRVPAMSFLTIDASADMMKLNQVAYAHIRSLPTASTYHATNGYTNGANDQSGLLTDVPVTMSEHAHVTLKLDYLSGLTDEKIDMAFGDAAFVLAKQMVDFALTKAALAANTTYNEVETVANTDLDTLSKIRQQMNTNKADSSRRYGLVSSAVASKLNADPLIASKDYSGAQAAGEGLLSFNNVGGFKQILEYPDLPTTANMTGLFFDPRLMAVRMAIPKNTLELAASLGFVQSEVWEIQQDPETGIALLMIKHGMPGVLDKYISFVSLYGASAGAQGGSAGTITDKAGCRLITA
jgi:hypothetical protein